LILFKKVYNGMGEIDLRMEIIMKEKSMKNFGAFIHGGDYNPDQWLERPDVL